MKYLRYIIFIPTIIFVHFAVVTIIYNLQHLVNIFGPIPIFLRYSVASYCAVRGGIFVVPSISGKNFVRWIYVILIIGIILNLLKDSATGLRLSAAIIEIIGMIVGVLFAHKHGLRWVNKNKKLNGDHIVC